MAEENFPSFKKAEKKKVETRSSLSFALVAGAVLVTFLAIFLSFRFLVGTKTPRGEILGKILSSSQSRQSSLLLEWIQNIDQKPEWKPNESEQKELLRFARAQSNDLAQETKSPALYAIHVASWGPGLADKSDLFALFKTSLGEEARISLLLFLVRQKDQSDEAWHFVVESPRNNEAFRKIYAIRMAQCVEFPSPLNASCDQNLVTLLSDSNDEVRWNAMFGMLRARQKNIAYFHESEIESAVSELNKLYALLKSGDTTLLSRFQGSALDSLTKQVFEAKLVISPAETKQDLERISNTHVDLRVRNIARSLQLDNR